MRPPAPAAASRRSPPCASSSRTAGSAVRILPARSGDELRSLTKSALREKPRDDRRGRRRRHREHRRLAAPGNRHRARRSSARHAQPLRQGSAASRWSSTRRSRCWRLATRRGSTWREVNGRTFLNNSSLGIYPGIVRDRERQQRSLGRGKRWALVWATLRRFAAPVPRREARPRRQASARTARRSSSSATTAT